MGSAWSSTRGTGSPAELLALTSLTASRKAGESSSLYPGITEITFMSSTFQGQQEMFHLMHALIFARSTCIKLPSTFQELYSLQVGDGGVFYSRLRGCWWQKEPHHHGPQG